MPNPKVKHINTSHIDDETLVAFLETALEPQEEEHVKAHVKTCSECLLRIAALRKAMAEKERLHLTRTPADFIAKAKQLKPTPAPFVTAAKEIPQRQAATFEQRLLCFFGRLKGWLKANPAFAYGAPAAATAAILLFILLRPQAPIENFSINDQLVISESGPFGFVGEPETIEYKGMAVQPSEDGAWLIFTWSEIPDALFYEIHLIENDNKKRITPLGGVLQTSFSFPKQEVKLNVEYVWELSGKMEGERWFSARAGFIRRE